MSPIDMSPEAREESNKLTSTGAWLVLLDFYITETDHVRVCKNNESVIWNGYTWLPYPFEVGEITESKEGELPTVDLNVPDIERRLTPIIEENDGGIGLAVDVIMVHSDHLDLSVPEFKETFEIVDCSIDYNNTIKFSLGAENFTNYRSPQNFYLKGHCRYEEFKGPLCGYEGPEIECNRTFERCRELGNQMRFGGFPGVGSMGFYV